MESFTNQETEETAIGPRVAQLANRLKVKQTRIAQDCEISRISVNRFFRGRSEIRATDLVNVLKVLGINLEEEIEKRLQPGTFDKLLKG